jgi:hypothetical protein
MGPRGGGDPRGIGDLSAGRALSARRPGAGVRRLHICP